MSASTSELRPVSAYIPCYNNAKTIEWTVQGMKDQTHPVDELFVVDDGSSDHSVDVVESLGVRVIRMEKNQGRGAVRARAMEAARNELVICCDATNRLTPNFLEGAIKWFSSDRVLAVFGRWFDRNPRSTVDRWRARHLFGQGLQHEIVHGRDLSTHGTLVRKSATMKVGNYNRLLRHGEDFDLGLRLAPLGDMIYDPSLMVETIIQNSLFQVMERYARWNRASFHAYTLTDFIDSHVVAWKILIPRDLKNRDWRAALISTMVPYFSVAYADKKSLYFGPKSKLKKPMPLKTNSKRDA